MAKVLEIVGKVWRLNKCIECPLLDCDAMCVIDNKHRPKFDEECEDCPLPDATDAPADVWPDDENHRLGPNGERLSNQAKGAWLDENTYVEQDGTTHKAVPLSESCVVCSLLRICNTAYIPCRPEDRSDGKQVMFAKVQKVEIDKCKP